MREYLVSYLRVAFLSSVAAILTLSGTENPAEAALMTGDIAFIGFNADGDDGFSVVALADITAGETIFFRDEEWDGVSAFTGSGEGEFIWTTPALSAGSVVTFVTDAGGTPTASAGATGSDPGFAPGDIGISGSGETVWAFQGTSNTPTTFLASVSTDAAQSYTGTGLSAGTTAVVLASGIDGSQYVGDRSSEAAFADYLSLIGDVGSNWSAPVDGGGDQSGDLLPFDTTAFSVVPEPSGLALVLLSGLMVLRRNR